MSRAAETTTHTYDVGPGTVEYETVECDSCGNECMADDARTFAIGKGFDTTVGHGGQPAWVFKKKYDPHVGVACPLCYEEGPISFPERVHEWALNLGFGTDENGDGFLGYFALSWALLPMVALMVPTTDNDAMNDFAVGAGFTVWVFILWAGIAAAILWVMTP